MGTERKPRPRWTEPLPPAFSRAAAETARRIEAKAVMCDCSEHDLDPDGDDVVTLRG